MSTLSISHSFTRELEPTVVPATPPADVSALASSAPVGPLRLTRRGRAVVVVAFVLVACVLMTAFGGWASATLHGERPASVDIVTVVPGQTLYGIAGQIAEPGHVREMVLRIEQLNSLDSTTIQPGQHIAVPRS